MTREIPLVFSCNGENLIGILHQAPHPSRVGMIIVVGGPQYRVGSHRQFTLLARHVAARGYPVLRFDCRGMGDSSGEFPGFQGISADIAAALDAMLRHARTVESVALWGLCDGASAALMYPGLADRRIAGVAMANPWVRTEVTLARTFVKRYYFHRLASREFWAKLLSGKLNPARAAGDLAVNLGTSAARATGSGSLDFITAMRRGLAEFDRPVLVMLSGNDITAAEFADVASTPEWRPLLARSGVTRHMLREANHTFSSKAWSDEVAQLTADWLGTLVNQPVP